MSRLAALRGAGGAAWRLVKARRFGLLARKPVMKLVGKGLEIPRPFSNVIGISRPQLSPCPSRSVTVAMLADADTLRQTAYEWEVVNLCDDAIRREDVAGIDFVFITGGYQNVCANISRADAEQMAATYGARGVPIAVWVRSRNDIDELRPFVNKATVVFATDEELVTECASRVGTARCHLLPPLVQPMLDNPMRPIWAGIPLRHEVRPYLEWMRELENHTWRDGANQILEAVGLSEYRVEPFAIAPLVATIRPDRLTFVLRNLTRQRGVVMRPVIATHGFVASENIRAAFEKCGIFPRWIDVDKAWNLGRIYAHLAAEAEAPYVAKMDDDDIYGPYYLLEAIWALSYSGADLVGKHSYFVYDEALKLVKLHGYGHEHCETDFVAGATYVMPQETVFTIGFSDVPNGEDIDFAYRLLRSGGRIHSTGAEGFVVGRWASQQHTTEVIAGRGRTAHAWAADPFTDRRFGIAIGA